MKRIASLLPLLAVGCAGTQTGGDAALAERCGVADCFSYRDVRDFEVIDRDTVVVYVGVQQCPFVVELQQDFGCDMSFTPAIGFFQTVLGRRDRLAPVQSNRICSTTRGLVLYAGIVSPSMRMQREEIESGLGAPRPGGGSRVSDGSFPVDPMSDNVCRVRDVRPINDDQLVELYAEAQVVPPPLGSGELEVPEEQPDSGGADEEGAATPVGEDAPAE